MKVGFVQGPGARPQRKGRRKECRNGDRESYRKAVSSYSPLTLSRIGGHDNCKGLADAARMLFANKRSAAYNSQDAVYLSFHGFYLIIDSHSQASEGGKRRQAVCQRFRFAAWQPRWRVRAEGVYEIGFPSVEPSGSHSLRFDSQLLQAGPTNREALRNPSGGHGGGKNPMTIPIPLVGW
jgi:hypothetical protein